MSWGMTFRSSYSESSAVSPRSTVGPLSPSAQATIHFTNLTKSDSKPTVAVAASLLPLPPPL